MNKRTKKKIAKSILKRPILLVPIILVILALIVGFVVYKVFFDKPEEYEIPEGSAEIHYIDVGQGDATLVLADGMSVLIDTGVNDSENVLINYLKDKDIQTLDYFIITHFDSDHYGEAADIVDNFKINNLILPDQIKLNDKGEDQATYKGFMDKVAAKNDEIYVSIIENNDDIGQRVICDDIIDIDDKKDRVINVGVIDPEKEGDKADLELEFFAPIKEDYKDSNDYSVVFMLRWGATKMLFTGDAEKNSEADIVEKYGMNLDDLFDCDVFKAGHHGSRTSSCEALLNAASPKYIIISCGIDNSYGHPHSEAMERFNNFVEEDKIYRTDKVGTIILTTDGQNITVSTEK
jgi:beta-lactamase superfamily II metal-dependent hydrolase